MRRTGGRVRRVRCRPDGRVRQLARWQTHGASAHGRRLDLGEVSGDAFEVFCQLASGSGDISQRAASTGGARYPTGRSLAGTPRGTRGLPCGLGAASGRSCAIRRRTGLPTARNEQRAEIEQVFTEPQSRPSRAPIIKVQQSFQLLQLCFTGLLGVKQGIDQAAFPQALAQVRPGVRSAFWIEQEPSRVELTNGLRHADCAFEDALVRVQPCVEHGRHLVADRIAEEVLELAAHVLLELDDLAVDDLHPHLDRLLHGPGFLTKVVEHVVDVPCDLFDLLERVAFDDQHQVVPDVGQ
ncbi:hypothetical protein A5764_08825 [Mycobacterium sp. 852002-51057_SCH5723018]|nr:hypothetical protein A5764_08825 [Mycobacterium sp. 852002-51057_SCH5723018]